MSFPRGGKVERKTGGPCQGRQKKHTDNSNPPVPTCRCVTNAPETHAQPCAQAHGPEGLGLCIPCCFGQGPVLGPSTHQDSSLPGGPRGGQGHTSRPRSHHCNPAPHISLTSGAIWPSPRSRGRAWGHHETTAHGGSESDQWEILWPPGGLREGPRPWTLLLQPPPHTREHREWFALVTEPSPEMPSHPPVQGLLCFPGVTPPQPGCRGLPDNPGRAVLGPVNQGKQPSLHSSKWAGPQAPVRGRKPSSCLRAALCLSTYRWGGHPSASTGPGLSSTGEGALKAAHGDISVPRPHFPTRWGPRALLLQIFTFLLINCFGNPHLHPAPWRDSGPSQARFSDTW